MPGNPVNGGSGRREPVRGDTSSDNNHTITASASASAGQQPAYKGGFPPSPPSTVDEDGRSSVDEDLSAQTQGALRVRGQEDEGEEEEESFDDEVESDGEEYDDEEDDDEADGAASQASSYLAPASSVSSSTKQQLTVAATAIAGAHRNAAAAVSSSSSTPASNAASSAHQEAQHHQQQSYPTTSSFSSNASSLRRLTHPRTAAITTSATVASRMPDTPLPSASATSSGNGISVLSHHPTASAQAFFAKILADFPTAKGSEGLVGVADDASVDVGMVCPAWEGAVLDQSRLLGTGSTGRRTLYALLPSPSTTTTPSHSSRLREDVLSLLDLASERLACSAVVIAVDKAQMQDDAERKATLHGLCYVGGSVVSTAGARDPVSGLRVRRGVTLVGVEL